MLAFLWVPIYLLEYRIGQNCSLTSEVLIYAQSASKFKLDFLPSKNFVTLPLQAILFPTSYLLTVVPNKQENSPKFTTLRRPNTLNP